MFTLLSCTSFGLLLPGRPNSTSGSSSNAPAATTHSNCLIWGLGLGAAKPTPKPSPCLGCLFACGLLSMMAFSVRDGSLALCRIVGTPACL